MLSSVAGAGLPAALLVTAATGALGPPAASPAPGYASSKTCRECHERLYHLRSTPHHGLAMQPHPAELARTRLTTHASPLSIGKCRYRAEPTRHAVIEQGPDGEKTYRIEHVLGGKNVWYFLTAAGKARAVLSRRPH